VLKELENLDISKSTGIDGLGPRILKLSAPLIADSLTHIINLSLCTGIFPNTLKKMPELQLFIKVGITLM